MRTSLRVGVQYAKVVKVADVAFDPLVCVFLDWNAFCFTVNWQIVKYTIVYGISVFLRIKRDVKSVLL